VLFGAGGRPAAADLSVLPESLRGVVASCVTPEPAARPAARQVIVRLIGHESPQAGVLAEGSRRAARAAVREPAEAAPSAGRPASARPGRRSRAIGWVAAAAVCVLAIGVAVHVLQDASSSPPRAVNPASATRPDSSKSSSRQASPTVSPTITLPASVAGTWSGSVQQGSGDINTDVKLNGNSPQGTITYSGTSFTCSGNLTLVSTAGGTLTMDQEIVAGICLNGVVKLRQTPDGALRFDYKGASSLAATGTLTRQ
jgi:hypothetical protein